MSGDFQSDGYQVVPRFITPDEAALITLYALRLCQRQSGLIIDSQVAGGLSAYHDPLFDALLFRQRDRMAELTSHDLVPTYAYGRVYLTGAVLDPHVDRPACEVSATLVLGLEPAVPWPIYVDADDPKEIVLSPGDALLYRGCEVTHWREAFAGRACVQVFLHYVDREGPNAAHAFDALVGADTKQPKAVPTWGDAEGYHQWLAVYQELLAAKALESEEAE